VTILRKKFSAAVALSFPSFKCEFWFPNFDLKLTCTRCCNSTVTTGSDEMRIRTIRLSSDNGIPCQLAALPKFERYWR